MTLDPVLGIVVRAALTLLFATAAWHKLRDVGPFRAALDGYGLLPPVWAVPAGAGLIAAEAGIAIGLCLPGVGRAAALAGAALLLVYAAAMSAALRHGRAGIDCGCAGPARRQPLRPVLVARNAGLAVAALLAALPAGTRDLGWLDVLTAVLATAALVALYAAGDRLLANAPALAALRAHAAAGSADA